MTRQLLHVALTAVLLMGTAGAGAQSPPSFPGGWGSVSVPGGFAALQQAIQTPGMPDDWRVIPLAIELSYSGLDGLRTERNVAAYAATLRRLHEQAGAVSADRVLSLSSDGQNRAAVDALLETLGLEFERGRRAVRPRTDREAVERTRVLARAGLPMTDLANRLNAGDAVPLSTRDGLAPLPLGPAFWQDRFDPRPPPHDLLWAILSSREMSSLYYALLGFDEGTLAAVAADTNLAAALIRHALVVPVVVPALRVHDGRIVPPGGAAAAAMWVDLVGKRLERPADFVNSLLASDGGRLAYFYRTLAVLPKFPTSDREHLRRLYSAFAAALREWRPDAMAEPPYPGPADVLIDLRVNTDGTLAGAPWRNFWRRAFESDAWPSDPVRDVGQLEPQRLLDPAELLSLLCPQGCDLRRMAAFALVQHEFPHPTAEMAPAMLAAVRARLRYPSLALEIARMKLADPSIYVRLGASAARIEGLPQPQQAVTLVQLQSAVALLARLRSVGAPAEVIREKATALASVPVTPDGFDGGVARWIGQLFQAAADESVDDVAIRSLAGAPWLPPGRALEWEGVKYRVDIAATEESRIHAIREKFSANVLSAATTLVRIADTLPDAVASGSVDASVAELNETLNAAVPVEDVAWTGESSPLESFRDVPREVANARKARPSDRGRIERAMRTIRSAADVIAADALAALVYALTIQDPDSPYTMTRELPRRHRLQPESSGGNKVSPWELPVERVPDRARRYISGSFLGLAAGVPQLAMRRLAAGRPVDEPNMSMFVATELQRSAALAAPWTVAEEDLAAIHAARMKGAASLEAIHDGPTLEAFISKAGISGPRAGWLRWSMGRGQAVADMMTLEDLVRAGGLDERAWSWGISAPRVTCLCLTVPVFTWEMQGMPRHPEAAALTIVEPAIRVAIEIEERRLPAALAAGVLAVVMTDVIERSTLPHYSDVPAISRFVRRLPPARFDDYIAAVTARGPLVPVSNEPRAER